MSTNETRKDADVSMNYTPIWPALRAGLEWLYKSEQPDNAVIDQFGHSISLPHLNRILSFMPGGYGEDKTGVVCLDVMHVQREKGPTSAVANGLSQGECDAVAAMVAELHPITGTWNGGANSVTFSIGQREPISDSVLNAYRNYKKGCPRCRNGLCGCGEFSRLRDLVVPIAIPCMAPKHAHTINDAILWRDGDTDDDPVTWAHCAECHGDMHDHHGDYGGPYCGHTAGCPNCDGLDAHDIALGRRRVKTPDLPVPITSDPAMPPGAMRIVPTGLAAVEDEPYPDVRQLCQQGGPGRFDIQGGLLVVAVDGCTCDPGPMGEHHPGCGVEPVMTVEEFHRLPDHVLGALLRSSGRTAKDA